MQTRGLNPLSKVIAHPAREKSGTDINIRPAFSKEFTGSDQFISLALDNSSGDHALGRYHVDAVGQAQVMEAFG